MKTYQFVILILMFIVSFVIFAFPQKVHIDNNKQAQEEYSKQLEKNYFESKEKTEQALLELGIM